MKIRELSDGSLCGELEQYEVDVVCQKCKPILAQLEQCMKEFLPYEKYSSLAFYMLQGKFKVSAVPFHIDKETMEIMSDIPQEA